MQDRDFFSDAADQVLRITLPSKRSPLNRQARELSNGEKGLLHVLAFQQEGISAGALSRMMGIGSGGVANLLNSLEKKGYVQRQMSPTDRRSVLVSISESGRALVQEKQKEVHAFAEETLSRLGRKDTEEFLRILRRITEISNELCEKTGKGSTKTAT